VGVATMSFFLGFTTAPVLIGICFFLSFFDELIRTTLWAWLDAQADKNQQHGIVTGVINFLEDLGWTIGPAVAGFLFASGGASTVLRIGGVLMILVAFIVVALLASAKQPRLAAR
jgi:predicted MFS family arabinose efflux permease